ncbi:MAG TPA: AmmeMemoRadiSam system protein A [Candidatus Acidoferrum sp.]|jgi:AmmeMemoRadiSam system protein A
MPSLSEADRHAILRFARQVVVEAVTLGRLPEHVPTTGIFSERRGVFVTLRNNARLRGCIGVVEADTPLGDSVARCGAGAALQDPRFAPMRVTDLSQLQIEISLLSHPEPIDINAIEIGRHGLIIVSGDRRGLLLPQVAVEHNLDREQFLSVTCRKAHLLRDAWRDARTQILAFTCEVFAEPDRSLATVGADSRNSTT